MGRLSHHAQKQPPDLSVNTGDLKAMPLSGLSRFSLEPLNPFPAFRTILIRLEIK
ncbi:hypothetical protein BGS_0073 [Beggiatoa sp. SS]|nr:hypothetical protein BGS_0073 [Beggiatoa sp. SS]